ncbi:MAG: hypothetical protein HY796_08015 [Elusimicrobia bacterium]|nr:hypothetical protein [Elusimicrobiota bacterium]
MIDKPISATYENILAECEHCGCKNIYNRATDLKTFEPISGLDVVCLNEACEKTFRIIGDTISPAFEMFIFDCYELYKLKHYASCIINLTQAWETFFANFLRVELVYKIYTVDDDLDKVNKNLVKLYGLSKTWAFGTQRNIFINICMEPVVGVDAFAKKCNQLKKPPQRNGLSRVNPEIYGLIKRLHDSGIGELRNEVVHKNAYRPHKDEIDNLNSGRFLLITNPNDRQSLHKT